jgi:hypothetical protein
LSEEEVRVNMAYLASFWYLQPVRDRKLPRVVAIRVSPAYPRLINSEAYHADTCGGDYVCGEDGAWARHW